MPRSRISASSSTAPGSGLMRSETGIDMARRMRRMVSASAGSPQRLRHPVMSISAGELIETLFSVEMARASSPGRLLSMRSSASASTVAGSIPGIAARIRRRRPAASALRIGQEFGHSVPPTSMSATSRDFTSPLAGEVGLGSSRPRPGGGDRLGGHGGNSMIACMLRWLTSGESHGPQLTVVIEGLPSGLEISEEDLRRDLARRQGGHGRGGRQKIETDVARIVSGVRGGFTIGSPVTLVLENKDHVNWTAQMTASKEGFEPKVVTRLPPGLGSYVHWDRKLDGRLAQAVMSINAIKAVEFGAGFEGAARRGSEFHDQIDYQEGRFRHLTNRAGGITGGVTNGEPIDLRVAITPIATMKKPMQSIDLKTKEKTEAHYERSDVCVVPAAGVIGEAVVALTLAEAFLEKFGGDSMVELERNYRSFMESIAQ